MYNCQLTEAWNNLCKVLSRAHASLNTKTWKRIYYPAFVAGQTAVADDNENIADAWDTQHAAKELEVVRRGRFTVRCCCHTVTYPSQVWHGKQKLVYVALNRALVAECTKIPRIPLACRAYVCV